MIKEKLNFFYQNVIVVVCWPAVGILCPRLSSGCAACLRSYYLALLITIY